LKSDAFRDRGGLRLDEGKRAGIVARERRDTI
jgi:hypothetical protein